LEFLEGVVFLGVDPFVYFLPLESVLSFSVLLFVVLCWLTVIANVLDVNVLVFEFFGGGGVVGDDHNVLDFGVLGLFVGLQQGLRFTVLLTAAPLAFLALQVLQAPRYVVLQNRALYGRAVGVMGPPAALMVVVLAAGRAVLFVEGALFDDSDYGRVWVQN
jgi:hypothetical protein